MGRRRTDDPGPILPLVPGPVSNGEFVPRAPSARDLAIAEETLRRAELAAGRLGIDRRRFLQTAGGVAVMLSVVNLAGCGSSRRGATPPTGGRYHVPTPTDVPACRSALGSQGEFIFDGHTHFVVPDGPWVQNAPETVKLVLGMLPSGCSESNPLNCVNQASYVQDIFMGSDTTVALLSDVPSSGPSTTALPFGNAEATQELVAQLSYGGASRLLLHDVLAPNFGPLGPQLEDMSSKVATGRVAAFKVYTAWGPNGHGFSLEDPSIGLPVIQHAHELGVKVFCGHKGLPLMNFDASHNSPRDMVAVSRQFPDTQFVVFHGGWDPNHAEGPYDPANSAVGIDSLLKALDDYQVPPNSNVWADLGTVWRVVLSEPDQAAHVLGKLMKRLGEDRILWGTDAIWYGSPQPQIMAFRAFQITPQFQETYGYPELTDERKRKILGLNGSELFGLDTGALRCVLEDDPISRAKPEHYDLVRSGAVDHPWSPRGPVTRREIGHWLSSLRAPWSPL